MEAKLKRGRVLREILKQDRLSPLSVEFQLAWLTAFNRGLFDDVTPGQIGPVLERLAANVRISQLTLDHRDEQWSEAVTTWIREAVGS